MSSQKTIEIPVGKLSPQMCAVLPIITADQFLSDAVFRHIDIQNDSIEWDPIFSLNLGTGFRAAIQFAYAAWTDRIKPDSQLFEDALSMDPELQRACLKAIGMRWGI
jgi:hypothetical protein